MRRAQVQSSPSGFWVWAVEGKPVSVHLSLDTVREMRPPIEADTAAGRAEEMGGILLGRIRQVDDRYLVSVERFERTQCEHVRGPSWTLSARDKRLLARQMAHTGNLGAVGWFRTHTRPGLFLDQHDFSLFADFFPHPAAVALVIRPGAGADAEAGFFIWENGDIQRARGYLTFPFCPEALAQTAVPARPAPIVAPAPASVAPVPPPVWTAEPSRPVPRRTDWAHTAWMAAPVAAGLLAGIYWQPGVLRSTAEADRAPGPVAADLRRPVFAPPEPEPAVEVAETAIPEIPAAVIPEQPIARARAAVPVARPRLTVAPPRRVQPAPEPMIDAAPPPVAIAARLEAMPKAPVAETLPAETTVEAVGPSAIRRAVGSIPGLRFLKRAKQKNSEYTPPLPVERVQPRFPGPLSDDVPVRVRITVDRSGEVTSAELLGRNVDPDVATVAIEAARAWRFKPATLEDKPVTSEIILNFHRSAHASGI